MNLIIIVIVLLLLFGGGGGYYAANAFGPVGGFSVVGIMLVILVIYLLLGR